MRRMLFAVALMLVLPPPLAAQELPIRRAAASAFQVRSDAELQRIERERVAKARDDRDALNAATWLYAGVAGADWAVTIACVDVPCFEKTQAGFFLRGVKPKAAIPLGIAIDVSLAVAIRELVAPEHPKLARWLLHGLSGGRLVLVSSRLSALRRNAE